MSNFNKNGLPLEKLQQNEEARQFEAVRQHHFRNLEAARQAAELKEREDARLATEAQTHLAARQRELAEEQRKIRQEGERMMIAGLREQFFRANPTSAEIDWYRLKDEIVKNHLLKNMEAEATTEDLMKTTGNYTPM